MKSLKQHLQDVSEVQITIKQDTNNLDVDSPAVKCEAQPSLPSEPLDNESQPALQTSSPSGFTTSEPITTGMSAAASCDVTMEEDSEEPEADVSKDCTVGPEASKDNVKRDNESAAASRPAPSSATLMPEGSSAELPQINEDILKVLTEAVRQHRLTRGITAQRENVVRPGFKYQPWCF